MPAVARDYLASLQAAADAAAAAEEAYRRESADEAARRLAVRERAFRRRGLIAGMVEAATAAAAASTEAESDAVHRAACGAAIESAAAQTGWSAADAAWLELRAALGPCAKALVDAAGLAGNTGGDTSGADPAAAVAALEAWYRERFKSELVDLVGRPPMSFNSVVDF